MPEQVSAATPSSNCPDPETFRAWVQDCLALLGVSAARISRELELSRNTVRDFLAMPGRDIRMGTAHGITCRLRYHAADQGKALPPLAGKVVGNE